MLGTLLLVTNGDFTTLAISKAALFWGILAALSAAFYTLQPKYLLQHWRSPLVIGWGMLLGGIVMLVLSGFDRGAAVFDLEATTALAFVVCFGTILAFWSYLESIKYIRPTETSTLGSLEPLAAVLLSVLLLDIPFGPFDAGGSLLMMLAVFILSRLKR
jgi:drug/metabolite transporter (DMT)-like permease